MGAASAQGTGHARHWPVAHGTPSAERLIFEEDEDTFAIHEEKMKPAVQIDQICRTQRTRSRADRFLFVVDVKRYEELSSGRWGVKKVVASPAAELSGTRPLTLEPLRAGRRFGSQPTGPFKRYDQHRSASMNN